MRVRITVAASLLCVVLLPGLALPSDDPPADGWIDLMPLTAWRGQPKGWSIVGDALLDAKDPKRLATEPGMGILCNGPVGKSSNIRTVQDFGDVEVRFEFFLPRGSNSGIKFQEVYEIQLFDSHGVKEPKGTDAGGIYPSSEAKPKYHLINNGHPPLVNAALPAGQWQTFHATFRAPRFDAEGHKTADARISATLNGRQVQVDQAVATPTGASHHNKEKPTGAILLQGDHGPAAFRNIQARPLLVP